MTKRIVILLVILFAVKFFVSSYQKYQEKSSFQRETLAQLAPYQDAGKELLDIIQKVDNELYQTIQQQVKTTELSTPEQLNQYLQTIIITLESLMESRLNQTSSAAFQQFMITNNNVLQELLIKDPSGNMCIGISLGDIESIKKSADLISEPLRTQKLNATKAVLLDSVQMQPKYNFTDDEKMAFWQQTLTKVVQKYPPILFEQVDLSFQEMTEKAMVCQFFIDIAQEFIDAEDQNLSIATWQLINQ
ncbi:hypothetical protein [Wohlfahrtiimonas larvae]|uniref:Uncharacterized protein n=1 Tax=Wohlfahrtiimonas larvae TaxID=1157986 RepID=A0ABP9MUM4_9GAMM|nr:hypothetical protein [Wohlfahrtiimonas larvae]